MIVLATEKELEPLASLIQQYHAFEGIHSTTEMRIQAVIPLLTKPEFGRI